MCKLVQDYANERVIQEAVESAIEYDRPKEETISKLMKKFSLTEEQAIECYDKYALQPV